MEIKFNLRLQTLINIIKFVENMEQETMIIIAVGTLMIPFVLWSLWLVGLSVMWQLFMLGAKAGIILMTICMLHFFVSRCGTAYFWLGKEPLKTPRCTLGDTIFSVIFQLGVRIPSPLWNFVMASYDLDRLDKPTIKKEPKTSFFSKVFEKDTEAPEEQAWITDDDSMNHQAIVKPEDVPDLVTQEEKEEPTSSDNLASTAAGNSRKPRRNNRKKVN